MNGQEVKVEVGIIGHDSLVRFLIQKNLFHFSQRFYVNPLSETDTLITFNIKEENLNELKELYSNLNLIVDVKFSILGVLLNRITYVYGKKLGPYASTKLIDIWMKYSKLREEEKKEKDEEIEEILLAI